MSRVGRFAASIALLVFIAIGLPVSAVAVARARFGGASPLHGVAPPWDWRLRALSEQLTDETVVDVIIRTSLLVVWAAVAVIVVTTAVEVVHLVRHRGLPMPSVRGLGWAQPVSRFIAAGLIVVVPLASSGASLADTVADGVASGTVASLADSGRPDMPARSHAAVDAVPIATNADVGDALELVPYTVQAGDSVYAIATARAQNADDVLRVADDIIDANLGRSMGDGQRFTTPAYVEPGWVLLVPAAPTAAVTDAPTAAPSPPIDEQVALTHVVVEGDTLWDIAAAHLGDPLAWTTIWDLNAGHRMDDGRVFDDPDLILPGWTLRLAAGATDAPDSSPQTEDDGAAAPGTEGAEHRAAIDDAGAPAATDTTPADADAPAERAPVATTPADEVADTAPDTAALGADVAVATPSTSAPAAAGTAPTSTDAPVADSGGIGGPDEDADSGAPAPVRLEHAALLAAGVLAIVGVTRRRRLRSARPRHRVPEPPPTVHATERRLRSIDPGERAERADVACRAVAAEIADSGHRVGSMAIDDSGALRLRTTGPVDLPAPWTGAGADWHLDADVPVELLAPAARRVDMPCVTLVQLGVTDAGAQLLVDLEACGELVVGGPDAVADQIVVALAVGLASSIHAEVAHLVGAGLPSDALLGHRNAHHAVDLASAVELAGRLIGTTADADATTFQLRSRRTGGEVWEPAVVLATSGAGPFPDGRRSNGIAVVRVGRGDGDLDQATLAPAAGSWRFAAFGDVVDVRPIGVDDTDLASIAELLADVERPLDPIAELQWADDEPSADGVETSVPFVDRAHDIVVGVLGSVTVTACNGDVGVFERSKTVELIAWLATHRDRSTRSGARTALWEMDVRDATFANVVSEARRGLARLVPPPEGDEWVARTLSDSLPLHESVVTDADLVADRLAQARLEPPARAVETLRPAVASIRDLPFAGTNYLWPDAEGLTSNLVLLTIGAASELAAHALSLGDIETVFWATGQGLKVLPGHEELVGLRMQAHAHAGDLAGVRQEWASYERVLIADPWTDGEPAPKLVALRRHLLEAASNP